MRFKLIRGKNYKNYIQIICEHRNDLNYLNQYIKNAVTRKEFKPFMAGFNKWVKESYLINQMYVPVQFWQDIYTMLEPIAKQDKTLCLTLENSEKIPLYNKGVTKEDIVYFVDMVELPEYIDLTNPAYFYQLESVYRAILFKSARLDIATGAGKTLITYLYCKFLLDIDNQNKYELFEKIDYSLPPYVVTEPDSDDNYNQPPTQEQKQEQLKIAHNSQKMGENLKILIVVNRTSLVEQTSKEFLKWEKLQKIEQKNPLRVSTIFSGGKLQANANVIIGTYQSLKNYDKTFFDDFSVIIFDEAHTAKAYSIRNDIYSKCVNLQYILGLTATWAEYKSLDYLNCVAMMGALVYTKKMKQAIEDKNITPVQIKVIRIRYNQEESVYCQELVNNGVIGSEKYAMEKVFFQNHPQRNELLCKLVSKIQENQLILVESLDYIHTLMALLNEYFSQNGIDKQIRLIYGNIRQREREEIKNLMEEVDNMVVIATYETMSTGVSINNLHSIHFPNGGKSPFRINQGIGRGVRLHTRKEYLQVYDYWDFMDSSAFRQQGYTRQNIYKKSEIPYTIYNIQL